MRKLVFLNFTPMEFQGGVERWMTRMAQELQSQGHQVELISAHHSIANWYGKLILGRKFTPRISVSDVKHYNKVTFGAFIPFTRKCNLFRNLLIDADLVYVRFEIFEVFILLYFGGFSVFNKTVAGLRSALFYQYPLSFFDHLHNFVYMSKLSGYILKCFMLVHALVERDSVLLEKKFHLSNVRVVPNWIEISKDITIKLREGPATILYVGELSKRKGTDVLIDTIRLSSKEKRFIVVGDGSFTKEVQKLASTHSNVTFYGHLSSTQLDKIYAESDILFLPSRAEGFANVILEGLKEGLYVISSDAADIGLPSNIAKSIPIDATQFANLLQLNLSEIRKGRYYRSAYCLKYFSKNTVLQQLLSKVFQSVK